MDRCICEDAQFYFCVCLVHLVFSIVMDSRPVQRAHCYMLVTADMVLTSLATTNKKK